MDMDRWMYESRNEGENKDMNSWKHDEAFIKNTTGFKIDTYKYINSGMVVYSNKITKILNYIL